MMIIELLTVMAVLVLSLGTGIVSSASALSMNGGTCLGFQTSPTFCKFLMMPNGEFVLNSNWTEGAFSVASTENGYTASAVRVLEGIDNDDGNGNEDEGSSSNNDDDDNDNSDSNGKTYCDVPNPSNPCHDRKDYSEDTGLYTCIDGSHEADWRDCESERESYDEEEDRQDTGGSNPYGEEADQNCGGELCTDDEKEDSWTDEDERQCFENIDGALGGPVPC